MNFKSRLKHVRKMMREKGIGMMYLTFGANLWYLTGVQRSEPELTDSNTYGNYICGAYIGANEGVTIVAPRMGGEFFQKEAEGKPWIDAVRIVDESEKPKDVLAEVLKPLRLNGSGVSMDDRAWIKSGLLFQELLPNSSFSVASDIIAPMRMIKDSDEINLMRKASEIVDKVFGKVIDFLKIGVTEYDVAHEVDYQFKKHGVEYNSFVTEVRFTNPKKTQRTHLLRSSDPVLENGDAITVDFGACYKGYCSDFGRSAFMGEAPAVYLKIHDLIMEAQAAAIEKMVDGTITAMQLDTVARSILEAAGYGANFTHRLGHGIGVTVHEPPFLYKPDETVLRSNMTFTIEPSIRLPNSYACRVEDVVMVTSKGGVPFNSYHKELTII